MFCTKCGNQVNEGAAFCTKCGNPIGGAQQPRMQAPVQQPVQKPVQPQMAPVQQPIQQPVQKPVQPQAAPIQQPVQQPVQKPVQPQVAPMQQPVQKPVQPQVAPIQQPIQQPVQKPVQPQVAPIQQPIQQPVQKPVQPQMAPMQPQMAPVQKPVETKPKKEKANKEKPQKPQGEKPSGKGGKIALLIILIAIVVLLAGIAVFYFFFGGDKIVAGWFGQKADTEATSEEDVAQTDNTDTGLIEDQNQDQTTEAEPQADEGLTPELQATYDYILAHSGEEEILEDLADFALENHCGAAIEDKLVECYNDYQAKIADNVNRFYDESTAVGWYMEIKAELDSVREIADKLVDSGVQQTLQVPALSNDFDAKYKQRFIDEFVNQGNTTMSENGVVSRSCLWNAVDGVETTGLIDTNNVDDPLGVCYDIGLAMHVDSALDSCGSDNEKLEVLWSNLEATHYSPLLVYYMATLGDATASNAMNEVYNQTSFPADGDIGSIRNYMFNKYRTNDSERATIREIFASYF